MEALRLTARLLRPMRDAAEAAIAEAADSLTFNPRGRRHRADLARVQELLDVFTPILTQVIGMTRAVYDRYDSTIATEPRSEEHTSELQSLMRKSNALFCLQKNK